MLFRSQGQAGRIVVMHVAGGDQRYAQGLSKPQVSLQFSGVVGVAKQRAHQITAVAEQVAVGGERMRVGSVAFGIGEHSGQEFVGIGCEVGEREAAFSFRGSLRGALNLLFRALGSAADTRQPHYDSPKD